jgi:hypothetical protein
LNPTYNHKARGKGKSGKLKGVIGVISGVQKGREKHSKNTFRSGFNRFEQWKDLKSFENQLKKGKTRYRKYGIPKI